MTENKQQEKETMTKSGKRIAYNKRGNALVQVSAQIPLDLYEVFLDDVIKQELDETKVLIRILKKYYNFK